MKSILIPALAAGAILALAPLAPPALASSSLQQGGLKRLDPAPKDPGSLDDLYARDFDRERWKARLSDSDLERRETSYEGLLRRAGFDPAARAFLEELARDPAGGEAAWTARLALRELGRARFPLPAGGGGPFGRSNLGLAPLGGDPFQRMQEIMNRLLQEDGLGLLHPPPPGKGSLGPSGSTSGRSVRVEQGPDGARIQLTEIVDGREKTSTYPGASLEEILADNQELRQALSGLELHVPQGAPLDMRFDVGGPGRAPARRGALGRDPGLPLLPQGLSRPLATDRLGVIVQAVPAERAHELGLEGQGLLVERTVPETIASVMGVKAGDILLELQGTSLKTGTDIDEVMKARAPKDPLSLAWLDELGQRQKKVWTPTPEKEKR